MPDTTPTPQKLADEVKRLAAEYYSTSGWDKSKLPAARERLHAAIDRMREALEKAQADLAAAQAGEKRCEYCDGAGDVVDQIGEWRGVCICPAGKALARPVAAQAAALPAVGSVWRHTNGNLYTVEGIANEFTQDAERYPVSVVYRGNTNALQWVRPAALWGQSMTLVAAQAAEVPAAPPSPVARVPLTKEQIDEAARGTGVLPRSFEAGVRFAEAAHGIGPQDGGGEG